MCTKVHYYCLKNSTVIGLCKFFGNEKDPNYRIVVGTMLANFQQPGCRMSKKGRFLNFLLKFFPSNSGAVSCEQGERYHKDIKTMETN